MAIELSREKNIDTEHLLKLYQNVGWSVYTKNIDRVKEAIMKSLDVITAWEDDELVGLIRTIGDEFTILYIQDIVVQTKHQKKGIGSRLLQEILDQYEMVQQIVLLTDEAKDVRAFYEKNGFKSCDQGTLVAFAKIQ